jgi:magnesium chelatase family protein
VDRIDILIEVPNLPRSELRNEAVRETSAVVRERVTLARHRQLQRGDKSNRLLEPQEIEKYCKLSPQDERLLDKAIEQLGLSARAWHRILKVARTIADLSGAENILTPHLAEAITYRRLERQH